jgi:hypothetical protein
MTVFADARLLTGICASPGCLNLIVVGERGVVWLLATPQTGPGQSALGKTKNDLTRIFVSCFSDLGDSRSISTSSSVIALAPVARRPAHAHACSPGQWTRVAVDPPIRNALVSMFRSITEAMTHSTSPYLRHRKKGA